MKIGFVGMGNMALALAEGFVSKGVVDGNDMFAFAPNQEKLKRNADRIGFTPVGDVKSLVQAADMIIIACKPYQIEDVLGKVSEELKGKALVSVAAGWVYSTFAEKISGVRIQCIMPNTPAMVGEGVFLFEEVTDLTSDENSELARMFEALGKIVTLPTRLMGIGGAVSGCGPAFMDLILESYADAAVKYGVPRATAYELIGQTMLGSAKLMLETGKQPGVLKDEVCSPGGTTIRGVAALEEYGIRNACIKSIDAIMNK